MGFIERMTRGGAGKLGHSGFLSGSQHGPIFA
jgi:hypothetical protein